MTPSTATHENYDIKIWGEVHGGMVCAATILLRHGYHAGFQSIWGSVRFLTGYCFKGEMIMRYDDGTEEVVKLGCVLPPQGPHHDH